MPHNSSRFSPKLWNTMSQGYTLENFKADALSGLTVAVVALPLSMAIAIASHVTPGQGLFTAIVGGLIISLFGGSRFQIGGPAGAFIVLIASIVDKYGMDGLLLATLMAGIFIFAVGQFRLGSTIRYVPEPVVVGFTAGIAIIIFASQLKELFGLQLLTVEPGALFPKLLVLLEALPSLNFAAVGISIFTISVILGFRKFFPRWPSLLFAVVLASLIAVIFHLQVTTIGTKFGAIPHGLPVPHLPAFSFELIYRLLPSALAIALLGSIESLLSAVVADKMSGTKHNSNTELTAQGLANIACALFGGIVATGTIARTATNVRAGAFSPVSGVMHSAFILLFMLVAAPLAGYVPLAALAGVLAVVCWNMADKEEVRRLLLSTRRAALVLGVTIALTLLVDLITGILAGTALYYAITYYLRVAPPRP